MAQKLIALVLSDAVATAPDGKFTLYGLFDTINCRKIPTRHPQFSIFWKIYSDQEGKVALKVKKPDGSALLNIDPVKVRPKSISQGAATFGGVEFPVSGEYSVVMVFNDSEEIGSTIFTIHELESNH